MSTTIKENISKNIAKYRKEKGLSQNALAEMVGAKNFTTVSSWERGISSPDADTIIKLCELLDITLYDLYEVNNDQETFSPSQREFLQKYENLDDHGKKLVDFVLNEESDRCESEYMELVARGGKYKVKKADVIELASRLNSEPYERDDDLC